MPSILPESAPQYPHLTAAELSARWRITIFTLSKNYRAWGLRPMHVGRRLLYPIAQIEDFERQSMAGEATAEAA